MWRKIRLTGGALFRRRAFERSMHDELRAHLEARIADLVRSGLTHADAVRQAAVELGNVEAIKEHLRAVERLTVFDRIGQELRSAVRYSIQRPFVTLSTVGTLGLAIGTATTVFAFVDGVLLRPLPVADGTGLVAVAGYRPVRGRGEVSGVRFEGWRAQSSILRAAAASTSDRLDVTLPDGTERLDLEFVSDDYFDLLGTRPMAGRLLTGRGASPADGVIPAVISGQLWRRLRRSGAEAIGRTFSVPGATMAVVGVVPDAFAHWRTPTQIWVRYRSAPALLDPAVVNSDGYWLFHVLARLQPGVTPERAGALLTDVNRSLDVALTGHPDGRTTVEVEPLRDTFVDRAFRQSLWLLSGVVSLLLVMVAVNVGGTQVAGDIVRRHQMAIRRALGATPFGLARQVTAECLLLACTAGGLGVVVAARAIPVLLSVAPVRLLQSFTVRLDARSVGCAAGLTALVAAALSAAAVYRSRSPRGSRLGLRDDARPAGTSARTLSLLLAGQLAVAVPVVIAAVIVTTSFARLMAIDPGFRPEALLAASIGVPSASATTPESARALHERLVAALGRLPGATAVAIGPLESQYLLPANQVTPAGVSITIEGRGRFLNGEATQASLTPSRYLVSDTYVRTLGLQVRRGRDFAPTDRAGSPLVALVNETMARLHWPGQDPVGMRVNFERVPVHGPLREPWTHIVGVVSDARQYRFDEIPRPTIYTPLAQSTFVSPVISVAIRTALPFAQMNTAIRRAIRETDPGLPVLDVRAMTGVIRDATATARYATMLLTVLAVIAVVLAAGGTYGLAAFAAAQRGPEIAIRMALGAHPARIRRLLFGQALRPVLVGLAAGLVIAILAIRGAAAETYGVQPTNPIFLAVSATILLSVATIVAYLPARRAMHVDPARALKRE
jgi:putative ABC transport system permease protein